MHTHQPIFFVFAGNNGSGKSTFRNLIIDKMGVEINIDLDAIARRIDSENPESKRLLQVKKLLNQLRDTLKKVKISQLRQLLLEKMPLDKYKKQKRWGMK
ncbi:hypothetical protein [Bacillus sp. V3B]|uniref:hypothetical protein n=1 Tax=Bacillus sp. V3B TaxID=2804915 RepID=UPI00210AB8EA|nr:hypothetical protein [Bacillus sp. V3B]